MLKTETPNAHHAQLDQYPTAALIDALVDDQRHAIEAVSAARGALTAAVDAALPRIAGGGRLIYVGAGTSGRLGKVHGNLMVDLRATNAKLVRRAIELTMRATGADEPTARAALVRCDFHVKLAIVVLLGGLDVAAARVRLDAADGSVSKAINRPE